MSPDKLDRMATAGRYSAPKKPVDPVLSARQKASAQRAREAEARFKAEYPELWAAEQAAKSNRKVRDAATRRAAKEAEARAEADRYHEAYKQRQAALEEKLGRPVTIFDLLNEEEEGEVSTDWGYR
jgi:hypothetical protein